MSGTRKGLGGKNIESKRGLIAMIALAAGFLTIAILHFTLPQTFAKILLDRGGEMGYLSIQNGMWLLFALGLGEIFVRYAAALAEEQQIGSNYLPEDERTVLVADDLPHIYQKLRATPDAYRCFLPRLLDRCILQFQASRSTDQSSSLMNTSMELFIHEVDLRYQMLRYISWAIPSLGFIGTCVGIGQALAFAGANAEATNLLSEITSRLAVAFDTTFLALVMASIIVLLQNIVQSREERALNKSGQYCLDNLINRLYVAKGEGVAEMRG